MTSVKELQVELKKWWARLQHPKLEAYERKLIQCEIAYLQKEIQDRQYINKKEYA
jgi:hypothetical protein|tara:strand:- start:150 stop:314 length:165 start_codon:yes stop_codon:yes gene_type:complete